MPKTRTDVTNQQLVAWDLENKPNPAKWEPITVALQGAPSAILLWMSKASRPAEKVPKNFLFVGTNKGNIEAYSKEGTNDMWRPK
eukprot:SAG11_NODE_1786_length_4258_cov_1.965617_2_plen_85_part_00